MSRRSAVSRRPTLINRYSLHLALLFVLLCAVWVGGGASRADALGQVLVRSVALVLMIVAALFADRPVVGAARPVVVILALALLLVFLQLLPLPPGVWEVLPGRQPFMQAATASGQSQPWRPLAIVPGAAINAAASLVVPIATLIFVLGLKEAERSLLPGMLLGFVAASMLLGLVQFSGSGMDNPLINETVGYVSGTFANRNHFALFLAIGCVLAPAWAIQSPQGGRWRVSLALGLVLLFILLILASGSRAGLALGALGVVFGGALAQARLRRTLRGKPRWVLPVVLAVAAGLMVSSVALSVAADRAVSVNRLLMVDAESDMRGRALPTVIAMIRTYFPVGSGLGGFDPLFRMHEPFALLKPTYFNHAHNDWLEIALDAGVPGIALLLASALWWGKASVRAWRSAAGSVTARLGSAILLLVMLASLSDYPARTPMMMVTMVVAGVWLAGTGSLRGSALPLRSQHL
ncbi:O-antigen ligase family protein [Sphingomonas sp. CFBP8993]|uniref:O-antigen ligase family protein n=1 Tax=Sphingomonas sp. CFBP8993 TaxID=3096526 RepID=UPI002A6AC4CA|nr:O-antigen ligase family protein [Sphingomonas sp. CFBP8993]MDY0960316.1 O-antigen ligase family protein [Sphingomonas sp. CFBP8993]